MPDLSVVMPGLTTSCPTRSGIWEIAGQAGYDNEVRRALTKRSSRLDNVVRLEMTEVNCNNDGVE